MSLPNEDVCFTRPITLQFYAGCYDIGGMAGYYRGEGQWWVSYKKPPCQRLFFPSDRLGDILLTTIRWIIINT